MSSDRLHPRERTTSSNAYKRRGRARSAFPSTSAAGPIHGLLGENGAGKSTLVSLDLGTDRPTEGRSVSTARKSRAVDVKAMEEPWRLPCHAGTDDRRLDVGRRQSDAGPLARHARCRWVDHRALHAEARGDALEGTGLDPRDARRPALRGGRSASSISCARCTAAARLIILDEPTTALTLADREHLFDFMRKLKARRRHLHVHFALQRGDPRDLRRRLGAAQWRTRGEQPACRRDHFRAMLRSW